MQHLECWATKLHAYKMGDAVHSLRVEKAKHVLKRRLYSNYLLTITHYPGTDSQGTIVGNLFQTFHLHVGSSILWFMIVLV